MTSNNALFGSTAARTQSKNLVEFRAGKMTKGGVMVHPDKRKGLLYVHQTDDSLMHFCWKDRTTGSVEDDLIIFPDDCEFKRVDQCTTGRVYVLKFKSTSRKFFFWVQEPKTDKDEENCKKINELINNPPTAGASRSGGATPDGDLQSLLGSMSQQQLMQLFGTLGTGSGNVAQLAGLSNLLGTMSGRSRGSAASTETTASSTTATTTSSQSSAKPSSTSSTTSTTTRTTTNAIQLSDLQNFLSNIASSNPSVLPATSAQPQQASVDLSAALNTESIAGVLADPSLVQELTPHLPNLEQTETSQEQLRSTLTSPQFQQAVSMFSTALQSGQLGPVLQQFQVGETAVTAANEGNLEEFVKALEKTNITQEDETKQPEKKKKTEEPAKKEDKDKDEDDKMSMD